MIAKNAERGSIDIIALFVLGAMLVAVALTAQTQLIRGITHGFDLFDEDLSSALYCTPAVGNITELPSLVDAPLSEANIHQVLCLPPRLDHAARHSTQGRSARAFCEVRASTGLPLTLPEGVLCD